jgi:uncharacterized protein (TIGR03118 family)
MGEHLSGRPHRALLVMALVLGAAVVAASPLTAAERNSYTVTALVSDQPGVAAHTDPNLVNAWGLTSGPTTPWWVSDNGTHKSTLYRGSDGLPQALVVSVGQAPDGGPTGAVFNPTAGFVLPTGGKALFIFDSEDGKVRGWNLAQAPLTNSVVVADRSNVDAIYKGLAIADTSAGPRLYAADFHNARVDVFDGNFGLVPGGFVDASLPSGYAPFGIQTIADRVFVTYAKQDADAEDELAGQSLGFVDVFSTAGDLLGRVAQHGQLNAPWGLALAPSSFGRFAGDLLVGNFGDGQINAYEELPNGHFAHRGELRSADGGSISIDGLWALQFGKAGNNGPAGTLFFTAGPDEETHGLFGSITPG